MGDIYKFGCENCGYKSKELHIGLGMMGPEYDLSAAPCFKCKTIRTFNIVKEEVRCKRCKSELELYDFYGENVDNEDEPTSKEEKLIEDSEFVEFGWYENVDFPCPKCKNPMMRIGVMGIWD